MKMTRYNHQEGYLIILTLIVIFAMTVIGLGVMSVVASQYQVASYNGTVDDAVYAAEAGASATIQQLNSNSSFTGYATTNPQTLYNTTSRGQATYTSTVTTNADGTKTIVAEGYIYPPGTTTAASTKRVQVIIKPTNTVSYKAATNISTNYGTCATAGGKAFCWGPNTYGNIGDGTTTSRYYPTAVSTSGVLSGETVLSVGDSQSSFACALAQNASSQGAAYCWGAEQAGYLGNGVTSGYSTTPVAVTMSGAIGNQSATNLGVGSYSSCLVASGKPYCWGTNQEGILGNGGGGGIFASTPVAVTTTGALAGKTTTSVAVEDAPYYSVDGNGNLYDSSLPTACVVAYTTSASVDGQAYCWGDNSVYQAGTGSSNSYNSTPVHATGPLTSLNVTQISTGNDYTCAVASGQAYCWGFGTNGDLGLGSSVTESKTPTLVNGGDITGKTVTAISAGSTHTCAIASGQAYCWGSNLADESGTTGTGNVYLPHLISGFTGKTVTSIWSSGFFEATCATAYTNSPADSQAYCWGGNNGDWDYGNGDTNVYDQSSTPIAVSTGSSSGFYGGGAGGPYSLLDYQQLYP